MVLSTTTKDLDPDPRNRFLFSCICKVLNFCHSNRQATLQVTDWTIALHVNLAFELAEFKSLPAPVQEHLKVLGDYSVQQLLIDFTSTFSLVAG